MNEDNHLIPADPFDEPLAPQESDRLILNDTYLSPPVVRSLWTVWNTHS